MPAPDSNSILYPKRWVQIAFTVFPIACIGVGYVFDNYGWSYLKEWLQQMHELDPAGSPRRNALVLACMFGNMVLLALVFTTYFWLMAYRIFQTKTFPPRGYPVVAKTMVLVGHPATRKAIELFLYGIFTIAVSAYVIWSVFNIFPETAALLRLLYG